jgi:hypothetical protein
MSIPSILSMGPFALAGLWLLSWSIWKTLEWRRFRSTVLPLDPAKTILFLYGHVIMCCVIRHCFLGRDYREIPLVSQGKSNHNICGVRLYCGSEVLLEYSLE